MYDASDVRVENVPDAKLVETTDALVRVTRACVCGRDLWPYTQMTTGDPRRVMGHEAIGVVDAVGAGVQPRSALGLECVGHDQAVEASLTIVRPGGAVGRVGVPQHEQIAATMRTFYDNVTIGGGPAPVRAYIDELLPDVLEGRFEPGRVFDRVGSLDQVPEGYRQMNEREVLKFLIEP
jgi:hypothetical protein